MLVTVLTGCSFISEPVPFTASEFSSRKKGGCGTSVWLPIVDTASTVAGATWVLRANSDLDDTRPHDETFGQYTVQAPGNGDSVDRLKVERAAGWTIIGVFGASAIYGYLVEARCAAHQKPPESAANPMLASRGFPASVLGYTFRMQRSEAATQCVATDDVWAFWGYTGTCKPRSGTAPHPRVELDFELGVPSRIRVVYPAPPQTANRDYHALADSLRKSFGAPRSDMAPWSAACSASLSDCLSAGEHPEGPTWHWPSGSLELAPTVSDGQPVIEIRYTRADDSHR